MIQAKFPVGKSTSSTSSKQTCMEKERTVEQGVSQGDKLLYQHRNNPITRNVLNLLGCHMFRDGRS